MIRTKSKLFLLAFTAAGTLTVGTLAAFAADLPVKAPPVYAIPDWSGFYVGFHGGYGWSDFSTNVLDSISGIAVPFSLPRGQGGLVGGHFGYNWQYYSSVVAGLEVDADYTNIRASGYGTGADAFGSAFESEEQHLRLLATARGRLGWLTTNGLLLYATGGLAWEQVETSFANGYSTPPFGGSNASTGLGSRFGFVVGAGVEAKLFGSNNWLGRVEYLHYDFGNPGGFSAQQVGIGGVLNAFSTSATQTVDVVRAGLTFKFP